MDNRTANGTTAQQFTATFYNQFGGSGRAPNGHQQSSEQWRRQRNQ
jgi:hypothetical protein